MDGNGVDAVELFILLVNKLVTTGWLLTTESSVVIRLFLFNSVRSSLDELRFKPLVSKLLTIGVFDMGDKDSGNGDEGLWISLTTLFGSITWRRTKNEDLIIEIQLLEIQVKEVIVQVIRVDVDMIHSLKVKMDFVLDFDLSSIVDDHAMMEVWSFFDLNTSMAVDQLDKNAA